MRKPGPKNSSSASRHRTLTNNQNVVNLFQRSNRPVITYTPNTVIDRIFPTLCAPVVLALLLSAPQANAAPRRVIPGQTATNVPSTEWVPIIRAGAGVAFSPPYLGVQGEAHTGVRRLRVGETDPVFDLAFEVGYLGLGTQSQQWHLGAASISPGIGLRLWSVRWAPRFLVGSATGTLGLGVRNEIIVGYLRGLIEITAGHSYLHSSSTDAHAAHVGVTIDIGLAFYALLGFFGPRNDPRPTVAAPPTTDRTTQP